MKNQFYNLKLIVSLFSFILFAFLFAATDDGEERCGCATPSVTIPSYAESFDDTEENWEYKDCAMAESESEKIHIYVYHNEKIKKYRCELRYTKPGEGNDCSMISKNFGTNAISTADISKSDYDNGSWKTYDYWFGRNI